ncbi:hypothetical protein EIP86_008330 [Pleurotus ostreatoroseus]|nr:hypothetical protein EIP86_008330 [Pleurotus ostreatoroseus]
MSPKPTEPAAAATPKSSGCDSPEIKRKPEVMTNLADGDSGACIDPSLLTGVADASSAQVPQLEDGAACLAAALGAFEGRDPLPPQKTPRTSPKHARVRAHSLPAARTPLAAPKGVRFRVAERTATPAVLNPSTKQRRPDTPFPVGFASPAVDSDSLSRSPTCNDDPASRTEHASPSPVAATPSELLKTAGTSHAGDTLRLAAPAAERILPTTTASASGQAPRPSTQLQSDDPFASDSPPPEGVFWDALSLLLSPTLDGLSRLAETPSPQQGASPPDVPSDAESASPPASENLNQRAPPPSPATDPDAGDANAHTRATSSVLSYVEPVDDSPREASPVSSSKAAQNQAPPADRLPTPAVRPNPAPSTTPWALNTGIAAQLEAAAFARPSAAGPQRRSTFTFTPRPEGGFRRIHHLAAASRVDKQRRDQIHDWDKSGAIQLLLQIVGYGALARRNSRRVPIPTAALNIVCAFLGHEGPCLSPPNLEGFLDSRMAAPHSFLLWNLTADDKEKLRTQGVISTADLSVILHDFSWITPLLLGMIVGLILHDPDAVYSRAHAILEDLLPDILDIAVRDNEVAANTARGVLSSQVLDSLEVRMLEKKGAQGRDEPEFYIYAQLPIRAHENFESARAIIAAADWRLSFVGNGTFKTPRDHWCTLCHGADHPRGLCPLPATPGWLGPPRSGRYHDVDDDQDDEDLREYDRELREQRRERERQAALLAPAPTDGARKRPADNQGRSDRRKAQRRR